MLTKRLIERNTDIDVHAGIPRAKAHVHVVEWTLRQSPAPH